MTARRRTLSIAAAVVAVAGLTLALMLSTRGEGGTTPATAAGDPGGPHAPVTFTKEQQASLLNVIEATSTSPATAEVVAEGRALFRSNDLAKDGESCQGCHTDGGANSDVGTTPHKKNPDGSGFDGLRDPPALFGAKDTAPYFWTGGTPALESATLATVLNHFRQGAAQPLETSLAQAAALAAYIRTIEAPEGDFSQGTMSASALRGEELFQAKAGCAGCHFGPDFTDNRIHDINVPQGTLPWGGTANDPGAKPPPSVDVNGGKCPVSPLAFPDAVVANPKMCAFNTPTLRGIGSTAPYFHNGVKKTLAEVVDFYNASSIIAPLNLTAAEKADLVEYLKAL